MRFDIVIALTTLVAGLGVSALEFKREVDSSLLIRRTRQTTLYRRDGFLGDVAEEIAEEIAKGEAEDVAVDVTHAAENAPEGVATAAETESDNIVRVLQSLPNEIKPMVRNEIDKVMGYPDQAIALLQKWRAAVS